MIVALYGSEATKEGLMIVLEPGNIEKLSMGQPIVKKLRDFWPDAPMDLEITIAFTPDAVWVAERFKAGAEFGKVLEQSLTREPVYLRESETLKRAVLPSDKS